MTKKEADAILDIAADNEYIFFDLSSNELVKVIDELTSATPSPVCRFLKDNNACLSGQIPWLKYKTCEAAIRAAHRAEDRDALSWFISVAGNTEGRLSGEDYDSYYGPLYPVKFFLDLIPKKYRTEVVAKKASKKATNVKSRSRR